MVRKVLLLALLAAAYSPMLIAQAQSEPTPPAEQRKESPPAMSEGVEILSDTMGVDFKPYLQKVMFEIKRHWYDLMPVVVKPPIMKAGIVIIQFAIRKDGTIAGLHLNQSSVDVTMDRAAYGAITASNPFRPLPPEFRGSYLALRIKFRYNPNKFDSNPNPDKVPPSKQ